MTAQPPILHAAPKGLASLYDALSQLKIGWATAYKFFAHGELVSVSWAGVRLSRRPASTNTSAG